MLGEAGQEKRVKNTTGPGHDHLSGLLLSERGLVNPGMHQRVKGVRQPHYLYPRRDAIPGQLVRITYWFFTSYYHTEPPIPEIPSCCTISRHQTS